MDFAMVRILQDKVWNAALEELIARGKFKAADLLDLLDLSESQRQTVRCTLHALEDDGWLGRENKQSGIWQLEEKGRLLLNASSDTIDDSRR